MNLKILITTLVYLCISSFLYGQDKKIYIKKQNTNFETLLQNLEKNENIRFFYNSESIPDIRINMDEDSVLLYQLLINNLSRHGISVSSDNRGNYFLFKNFNLQTNVDDVVNNKYININYTEDIEREQKSNYIKSYESFISENVFIGSKGFVNKKEKVRLSGIVSDDMNQSPVYQARIAIAENNKSVLTNQSGFYELELKPGVYTVSVSSMRTYDKTYKVTIQNDGQLNIPLQTKLYAIDEITISANQNDNVKSTTMGFEKISAKSIKELPSILGEKDIVKIALLLPGVQTIGELSSGFNVRGSPADQNIFYINDLPIYNSSHVFGLFTSFNGDAIDEFNFYKSNLPIEYGGHLASIFDIKTKKGNTKNFSARGGIGPTSGRILVEGPLKKDSSSYLISLRSSYSDWLLNLIENPDINNSSISFYDALFDISTYMGKKDKLDLFFYSSNDLSDLAFGIRNQYSNLGSSVKWTHVFNEKFKSELSLLKSRYFYDEENYEIEYLGYKHSFDLNHNESKLKFGYFLIGPPI